jgi:hypothetical protein
VVQIDHLGQARVEEICGVGNLGHQQNFTMLFWKGLSCTMSPASNANVELR